MRRPSPALVVAVIALIVAMSGTSYAVTQLPRNSVGAKQLKKNAVTAVKIKKNAVTGAKVKDGSLTEKDFAAGTLLQGPTGPKGDTGLTGPQGAQGLQGPAGAIASAYATSTATNAMSTAFATVVSLSQGSQASGAIVLDETSRLVVTASVGAYGASTSAGDVGVFECRARVTDLGVDEVLETTASSYGILPVPASADASQTIPVVATVLVGAGTYDVVVECKAGVGTLAVTIGANLAVVAAVD